MALVAYFSATGTTKRIAEMLARELNGEIYEIAPEVPYTNADLNWNDKQARSTREMEDLSCRPALANTDAPVVAHDLVLVGFPIWWYREPSIIDSFLDAYDFTGKTVVPFCTSGGSGVKDAAAHMRELLGGTTTVADGAHFSPTVTEDEIELWCENL